MMMAHHTVLHPLKPKPQRTRGKDKHHPFVSPLLFTFAKPTYHFTKMRAKPRNVNENKLRPLTSALLESKVYPGIHLFGLQQHVQGQHAQMSVKFCELAGVIVLLAQGFTLMAT